MPSADVRHRRVTAGPRGRLVMGSTRDLQRDPLGLLMRARADYGDVVRFRYFGPFVWYFFAHPDAVEHILVTRPQDFPKGVFGPVIDLIIPNGLVTADDAAWARQRRQVQPGLHASAIANLADVIVAATREHLDRWLDATRDARVIDVSQAMLRLSLDIAGRALLGSDLGEGVDVLRSYADLALSQLDYRVRHPLSPLPFLPTPRVLRYRRAVRGANATIAAIVARRRQAPDAAHDLLSMLLSAAGDGPEPSDDEVRDQVKTLLISGYETSGMTLAWFFYSLSLRPAIERRVRDEVRATIGDRPPAVADLQGLVYTRQVLNETLRLYPPAPWLGRQARQLCEVDGYRVPKGAVVSISPFVTHRHPDFWTAPDTFDPDRFSPDAVRLRPRGAFFPFGAGPRYCVGQAFAMLEMLLVIATVLPQWRFRLQPGANVTVRVRGTLQAGSGLPMTLEQAVEDGTPHSNEGAARAPDVDATDFVTLALRLLHLWLWALYAGGLIYIYGCLVPGMERWLASDARYEEFSLATANGLRWWIFGAILGAGATGAGLVGVRGGAGTTGVWWAIVGVKSALFLVTFALYAYVSYVMWPRRVFVAVADRPAERRRFLRIAYLLIALLTGQLLLGAVAHVLR